MIEFYVTANRAEGHVSLEMEVPSDGVIVLDLADALFLARRLLEEIGTFEGLAR